MIPFVREFDFAYGRVDRVSPLIRRLVCENPGPFTFTGTGTYILGSDAPGAAVAVIDPGPDNAEHLAALLEAVKGRRVSHIVITHTHRDHSPLARALAAETGAPIVGARAPQWGRPDAGMDASEDVDHRPDRVLEDGERISGDGWTLETVATPGHSSNHLAFALVEENALFSGDHVMGWSTTVVGPPDGDMTDYMASLDKVIARGFTTLWPTHGPPVRDPTPFLTAYKEHRLRREAAILDRLGDGDRTIGEMVPRLYAAIDSRVWPAAGMSTLAHLIKLVRDGRVIADPAPDLTALYRRA